MQEYLKSDISRVSADDSNSNEYLDFQCRIAYSNIIIRYCLNTGNDRCFRGSGPLRAMHAALWPGSRIGRRGCGILVQADPQTVPVLPVQGPNKVSAVTELPRPWCLDWIVRQRVQRAVQLVADLQSGMGPHGSTVGNGVDPAGQICRSNIEAKRLPDL